MASTEQAARPPQARTCACGPDGYGCPGARMLPDPDVLYAAGLRAARRWQDDERRLFRWTR